MTEALVLGFNEKGMKKSGYTAWKILAFLGAFYGLIAMLWDKTIGICIIIFCVVVWGLMHYQQKLNNN